VLFHSPDYLLFLPLVVLLHWLLPRRLRLPLMAASSLFFYASWSLQYLPVMVGVIAVAWVGGLWLAARERGALGRWLVALPILAPLLLVKYWDWVAWNVEWVAERAGVPLVLPRADLIMPVGISFFTFQALAYTIDVSRRGAGASDQVERDPLRFFTFIAWFPQLIAGPIVRAKQLMPALHDLPLLQRGHVGAGLYRIARGVFKKVVLADVVRLGMVDPVFADPGAFGSLELLVALYAYSLQIYCDFSGYTDMAIGSARLFGIELPENFRRPYLATSVAGFWRRWHITLSDWVRDYVYYPLGGSRGEGSDLRVYANIMLTLLIIALWHKASWNYVIYGLLHGSAVALNRWQRKRTGRRPDDPLPSHWAWLWRFLLTFHFVVLARVLFRAPDLATAGQVLAGLMPTHLAMPRFSLVAWFVFTLGFALHFSPPRWSQRAEAWVAGRGPVVWLLVAALVAIACVTLGTGEQLSFIYYQY
jgi:alginate O-acetyltransferase complex protein AlgI